MQCDHILVDGWNVIHAEPALKSLLLRDAHSAQKALADLLAPVHDMYSARVTIVYDGSGPSVSLSRPDDAVSSFAEVYTPSSMTADEFIERYCTLAKNKSRIVVISNDNMIWQTVSVQGAVCMRIGEIISYARRASGDIKKLAAEINFKSDRIWRQSGQLAKLDDVEIGGGAKSNLFSKKKMKKMMRLSRGGADANFKASCAQSPDISESKVDAADKNGEVAARNLAFEAAGISLRKKGAGPAAGGGNFGSIASPKPSAPESGKKRRILPSAASVGAKSKKYLEELAGKKLPRIFKDFQELAMAANPRKKQRKR